MWTNEYEFQFHSHDDVKHICAKMWHAMGVSLPPPIPIKSHHWYGTSLGPSLGGVLENGPRFLTKFTKFLKARA